MLWILLYLLKTSLLNTFTPSLYYKMLVDTSWTEMLENVIQILGSITYNFSYKGINSFK